MPAPNDQEVAAFHRAHSMWCIARPKRRGSAFCGYAMDALGKPRLGR